MQSPLNNMDIDISKLINNFQHQDTSSASILNLSLGLTQTSLLNNLGLAQQSQSSQLQQQQYQTAQIIQEKLNLYLQQQQQLQIQQQQLSELAALSYGNTSSLSGGSNSQVQTILSLQQGNAPFEYGNQGGRTNFNRRINLSDNSTQSQISNENNTSNLLQNYTSNGGQVNNFTTSSKENTSQISNLNASHLSPQFNFSSSAQNTIFQNLQNQMGPSKSKNGLDSCTDTNVNGQLAKQLPQKTNTIITQNQNTDIAQNHINTEQKNQGFNITIDNLNGSMSGRWTREEHLRFVKGLGMFGKNWKNVEEYVGTRSGAQIRSHAQKFLNKIQRDNGKNSGKQTGNQKNGIGSSLQDDSLPAIRKRQQSNYSVDLGSDDGDEENNQQNNEQYSDIIPENCKQKANEQFNKLDTKEWLHYYKLLQSTCQQNLESQKQNKSLSTESIHQMEEQLKKIQIFIQVLSACDNISQPQDCASPMSQGSPMGSFLPFSFDNLNINSPLMTASPGSSLMNKNQIHQSPMIEINTFSLDGNINEDQQNNSSEQRMQKANLIEEQQQQNQKMIRADSIFKRLQQSQDCNEQCSSSDDSQNQMKNEKTKQKKKKTINEQSTSFKSFESSGGVIQSKLKFKRDDNDNRIQHFQEENASESSQSIKKIGSKSAYSIEANIDDEQNQEEISEQQTNRPNNLSNSAISSNDYNSTLSTPENQKQQQDNTNSQDKDIQPYHNQIINKIPVILKDNIDIDSDFNQIKNIVSNNTSNQKYCADGNLNSILKRQAAKSILQSHEIKSPIIMPIASPHLDSCKNTPIFTSQNNPNEMDMESTSISDPLQTKSKSFKLEPSFFIFFMKKYGKYFDDPHAQTPKLSDLVKMNSQQQENDCVIEEFSTEQECNKSPYLTAYKSESSSPILKRLKATERAQNFMDLEEDYGSPELPILRKKQSSFSAYSCQNKGLLNTICPSNINNQTEKNNISPITNKYIIGGQTNQVEEKQDKIMNFRKRLKTTEYSASHLSMLTSTNNQAEQHLFSNPNQPK